MRHGGVCEMHYLSSPMKQPAFPGILCFCLGIFLYPSFLAGQKPVTRPEWMRLGSDQDLINGVQFSNHFSAYDGHPYWGDESFREGIVFVNGRRYEGMRMRYNLFTQRLEIEYTDLEGNRNQIMTVPEKIPRFVLDGSIFELWTPPMGEKAYYQSIRGGTSIAYVEWNKTAALSQNNGAKEWEFRETERTYWIRVGGTWHSFRNKKGYRRLFDPPGRRVFLSLLRAQSFSFVHAGPESIQRFLPALLKTLDREYPPSEAFQTEVDSDSPAHRPGSLDLESGARLYGRDDELSGLDPETLSQTNIPSLIEPLGLELWERHTKEYFILPRGMVQRNLPPFENRKQSKDTIGATTPDNETPTAEQRYMEGRTVRDPLRIQLGNPLDARTGERILLRGTIREMETGEPLVGATLYIPELQTGSASDLNGRFSLSMRPGSYQAECHCMGMETLPLLLEIYQSGEVKLSMAKTLIPLEEVVVRADRHQNVTGTQMGFERLNYGVFKEIPLVMGERDVLNMAKLLPGVQSVGEGSSGFNVRGSPADQNMITINQVPVYNSSHLFGFFTAFSPEASSDFTLYKSHLPARYGGRLSSFFDIRSKQGNMKKLSGRAGISSVSSYLALEGPLKKDRSSLLVSGRSTYSDWILRRMEDPLLRNSEAGFQDLSLVYTLNAGDNSRLQFFAYGSLDRFKLADITSFDYGNTGSSLDLYHRFNQNLSSNFTLIYSAYRFATTNTQEASTGYRQRYGIQHAEIKSDLEWYQGGEHRVGFGGSLIFYHLNRGILEPFGDLSLREPTDLGKEQGTEMALYVSDEWTLSPRWTLDAGLRLSAFSPLGPASVRLYTQGLPREEYNVEGTKEYGRGDIIRLYKGVEPRLNLRFLLNNASSVKASYTRGTQYVFMLTNTLALSPTDPWKLCDYHLGPQRLDQISAGYYLDIPGTGLSTSIEMYQKWGTHMVEYKDGANFIENPYVESETVEGSMRAAGVETMIKQKGGILSGWITYSYARSLMQVSDPHTGETINRGLAYPSNFDRPHNLTLVLHAKQGRRLSFSGNMVYMTGRPTTYPVAVYEAYGIPYIQYSDRNKYRIPDYFRIDLSMNMEGNLKRNKRVHSYWMLGVYNLTGRKNAHSVYFKNVNGYLRGYKLAIFGQPIVTLSYNLKLGNYASE
ncbi:MAG: TonB-dependent receptor [Bacteroidales bacterium]